MERTQNLQTAASISTQNLQIAASRRSKLLHLQSLLERECREEMDREAGEKSQVEGVHQGDHCSGRIGQRQDLPNSNRKVSTRKKKVDGDSSGTKTTSTGTHRRQMGGDALVCSPNDDVPYLQFITRKIEREDEDEDDASKQEEEEEEEEEVSTDCRRYAHASTSPTNYDHSSLVSFADDANEVDSSASKGGDALTATSSHSTADDDLVTKVKDLEERLERLGNHTVTHHYDSMAESNGGESINVSKDEHSDNSGANATNSSIDNISKGGDAEDLLGGKDSSPSSSVSRPRPPVLFVPHDNDAIYTLLTHLRSSVTTIDTSGPAQEQSIGFEGIVLGSLIDSIP